MLLACISSFTDFRSDKPADGLYIVKRSFTDSAAITPKAGEALIYFFPGSDAPENVKCLLINTNDVVPLELETSPVMTAQNEKQTIQLSFSKGAAEKLKQFTSRNIQKQSVLVVDGQALTAKNIRDTIHGGKMEISGGTADACQKLYGILTSKVKTK